MEGTVSVGPVPPGLAAEGAHVAVADLDQTAAQQVASGLRHRDRPHIAVWLDVTDASSVERAFADTASGLGGIDVAINVAGGDTFHSTFEETTDEVWVRMIELNLLSVVRCCRAAIPHLRRSAKSPAIVNVSSVNALAALVPYGKSVAVEVWVPPPFMVCRCSARSRSFRAWGAAS